MRRSKPPPLRLILTMKTNLRLAALLLATALPAVAAPLNATTAVHTQPDESSPTLAVLNAGSEPVVVRRSCAPGGTTPIWGLIAHVMRSVPAFAVKVVVGCRRVTDSSQWFASV